MLLSVKEVRQSGPVCTVVGYLAEFDLNDSSEITVVIDSVVRPTNTNQVEQARQGIADGFADVLNDINKGCQVVVKDLLLHPSDFSQFRYRLCTRLELKKLLVLEQGPNSKLAD